ncbi:hypothetical protein ACTFIY_001817 [Dictyostelium cf. discoideum]
MKIFKKLLKKEKLNQKKTIEELENEYILYAHIPSDSFYSFFELLAKLHEDKNPIITFHRSDNDGIKKKIESRAILRTMWMELNLMVDTKVNIIAVKKWILYLTLIFRKVLLSLELNLRRNTAGFGGNSFILIPLKTNIKIFETLLDIRPIVPYLESGKSHPEIYFKIFSDGLMEFCYTTHNLNWLFDESYSDKSDSNESGSDESFYNWI